VCADGGGAGDGVWDFAAHQFCARRHDDDCSVYRGVCAVCKIAVPDCGGGDDCGDGAGGGVDGTGSVSSAARRARCGAVVVVVWGGTNIAEWDAVDYAVNVAADADCVSGAGDFERGDFVWGDNGLEIEYCEFSGRDCVVGGADVFCDTDEFRSG